MRSRGSELKARLATVFAPHAFQRPKSGRNLRCRYYRFARGDKISLSQRTMEETNDNSGFAAVLAGTRRWSQRHHDVWRPRAGARAQARYTAVLFLPVQ